MFKALKSRNGTTSAIVNKALERAIRETGSVLDSEAATAIKTNTMQAMETASQIATNLVDVNGDGKFDAQDLKLAAQKAGIAWERIDADLKSALLAGGVAGVGVNVLPLLGQALAVPAFIGVTAYFYIIAKLKKLHK